MGPSMAQETGVHRRTALSMLLFHNLETIVLRLVQIVKRVHGATKAI